MLMQIALSLRSVVGLQLISKLMREQLAASTAGSGLSGHWAVAYFSG
jgi:hypothetical protein